MLPVLAEGNYNNHNKQKLEDKLFSPPVLQVSLLGRILVQPEMQMMFQMTVIQHQRNERRMMMKILKKILMMPTMMSLLVMVVLCSTKIPMIKMMKKLMQFMKLLMSEWMKKDESTGRKEGRKKLKSIDRKDQKFNSNSVTLKENCVQFQKKNGKTFQKWVTPEIGSSVCTEDVRNSPPFLIQC
jgi:hypothetical protein